MIHGVTPLLRDIGLPGHSLTSITRKPRVAWKSIHKLRPPIMNGVLMQLSAVGGIFWDMDKIDT